MYIIILIYLYKVIFDWGLGIGDWGLGIGPNPQSPIPNPQSPLYMYYIMLYILYSLLYILILYYKLIYKLSSFQITILLALLIKLIKNSNLNSYNTYHIQLS